ncbi:hypothetical protein J6590_094498, partial [Homalodisca vitripennis]
ATTPSQNSFHLKDMIACQDQRLNSNLTRNKGPSFVTPVGCQEGGNNKHYRVHLSLTPSNKRDSLIVAN